MRKTFAKELPLKPSLLRRMLQRRTSLQAQRRT
jgi:hypothetical protein